MSIPAAAKRVGIGGQTFYRWRRKCGAMKEDEAAWLTALEAENTRVEADRGRAGAGRRHVEGLEPGKLVSPARRRDAVAFLVRRHGVSRRRACKVVGQCRSTRRHVAAPGDFEARLVKQMRELSERYPRWGCSVVHALLVEDEWRVNRKRVQRLWREHELQVPPPRGGGGKKAGGVGENSAWNLPALRPGHVWS